MTLFRKEEAFRVLVVAAMMACLASAVVELAARAMAGFDPTLLVFLSFIVCLEGIASDRLVRQLPDASARLRLRAVEWVVILVVLRFVLSLAQGVDALAAAAGRWLSRPQSLVDGGLVAAALLLAAVWGLGLGMSRSLEALGPEADAPPPKDSAAYYAWLTRPKAAQRREGWQDLGRLFLGGGAALLIASGLARLDLPSTLTLRNPAIAGIVLNALLYFLLGFTLLAQGHYAMLRSRWERNQVEVARQLGRRWAALGLGFAVTVALLVLLLPTRPSLALFSAVFDVIRAGLAFLFAVGLTVFAVLGFLMSLVGRLFGRGGGGGESAPEFIPPPPQPAPVTHAVGWWEAIQGFVLWAVILGVVVYALARFIRERRGLWRELAADRNPLAWALRLLAALWRWLARSGAEVGARWRALVARVGRPDGVASPRRRSGWFHPRTAREQARLLYLLGLRETGAAGWPRAPADTPSEYMRRVSPDLAEEQIDLEALTGGFIEARYSPREFGAGELDPLRRALRRLRLACRRLVGSRQSPDE